MTAVTRAARVLIMPAGRYQLAAIRAARLRGLEVVAMDADPDAPGAREADVFVAKDPFDVSCALAVAREYGVSAVMSVASDPSVVPCSLVARELGLPGIPPHIAGRARNKHAVRTCLRATAPELSPDFEIIGDPADARRFAERFGYPIIIKPQASNGSRGVIRVERSDQIESAFDTSSAEAGGMPLLAEEFVAGREISVEGFVINRRARIVAITDKVTTDPPYFVEIGHSIPAQVSPDTAESVTIAVQRIADALELDVAPFHIEFKLAAGGPKLIEIGARLGGGCITSHLVPFATGVDMVAAALAIALAEAPALDHTRSAGAAIRFLTPSPGAVRSVRGLESARRMPGIEDVSCDVATGHTVGPFRSSADRVGHVIASGATAKEAISRAEAAKDAVRIDVG